MAVTSRGTRAGLAWALGLAVAASACGSGETTASRSAAAFDDSQRSGAARPGAPVPAGTSPAGHGTGAAHGALPPEQPPDAKSREASMSSMGHSAPPSNARAPEIDHSKMDHSRPASSDVERPSAPAGMDHSTMPGMDHAVGADHSKMDHSAGGGAAMTLPAAEPKAASAAPGQPAATLQLDALDRPAPTSIEDVTRAEAMNAEMAGGHGQAGHGTYQHLDAGREGSSVGGHEGHQAPKPRPSPKPDSNGHEGHGRPSQHSSSERR